MYSGFTAAGVHDNQCQPRRPRLQNPFVSYIVSAKTNPNLLGVFWEALCE
jgi:hypothetical protein